MDDLLTISVVGKNSCRKFAVIYLSYSRVIIREEASERLTSNNPFQTEHLGARKNVVGFLIGLIK